LPDFLDVLARDAKTTVERGYYEHFKEAAATAPSSLRNAILQTQYVPVIAEIKSASPSAGLIRQRLEPKKIALAMARGGATGISVLTEPEHFSGALSNLARVREAVNLPILMKDIFLSPVQLEAAARMGANAVLLIQAVFDRGYGELSATGMIEEAHSRGVEVLLEVHNEPEFQRAIDSDVDLVGINNRNLGTLQVDLNVTRRVLQSRRLNGKVIVSESGINTAADIRFLSGCGANAFLIGSAIISAVDVESKVREFTSATRKEELKS
jgi:indole-3-glycerol phosphate synthase